MLQETSNNVQFLTFEACYAIFCIRIIILCNIRNIFLSQIFPQIFFPLIVLTVTLSRQYITNTVAQEWLFFLGTTYICDFRIPLEIKLQKRCMNKKNPQPVKDIKVHKCTTITFNTRLKLRTRLAKKIPFLIVKALVHYSHKLFLV